MAGMRLLPLCYAWRLRHARARIGPSKHRMPRDVICTRWHHAAEILHCCCLYGADDSTGVLPRPLLGMPEVEMCLLQGPARISYLPLMRLVGHES